MMCYLRFHEKKVVMSAHDVHVIVRVYRERICARANLLAELQEINASARIMHMWVYAFYPIIKDLPAYQPVINEVAENCGSHTYAQALLRYGIIRRMPFDGVYSHDQRLYFYMMRICTGNLNRVQTSSGARWIGLQMGPYSAMFAKIIHRVGKEHRLPNDIIYYIFDTAYCLRIKSDEFSRALSLPSPALAF